MELKKKTTWSYISVVIIISDVCMHRPTTYLLIYFIALALAFSVNNEH